MRINETCGIFSHFEALDPAVIRAQRQAEIENMIMWRAERLEAIRAWSIPEKRAKIQAGVKAEYDRAVEIMAGKTVELNGYTPLGQLVNIKEVYKPIKTSWFVKLVTWLADCLESF